MDPHGSQDELLERNWGRSERNSGGMSLYRLLVTDYMLTVDESEILKNTFLEHIADAQKMYTKISVNCDKYGPSVFFTRLFIGQCNSSREDDNPMGLILLDEETMKCTALYFLLVTLKRRMMADQSVDIALIKGETPREINKIFKRIKEPMTCPSHLLRGSRETELEMIHIDIYDRFVEWCPRKLLKDAPNPYHCHITNHMDRWIEKMKKNKHIDKVLRKKGDPSKVSRICFRAIKSFNDKLVKKVDDDKIEYLQNLQQRLENKKNPKSKKDIREMIENINEKCELDQTFVYLGLFMKLCFLDEAITSKYTLIEEEEEEEEEEED